MYNWTDEDMLLFAKLSTQGSYGIFKGCKTLKLKLSRYKEIKDEVMESLKKEETK